MTVYVSDRPLPCAFCGEGLNGHETATPDRGPPAEGDVMVCTLCGNVSLFDAASHGLRKPNIVEAFKMAGDAELREVVRQARGMR